MRGIGSARHVQRKSKLEGREWTRRCTWGCKLEGDVDGGEDGGVRGETQNTWLGNTWARIAWVRRRGRVTGYTAVEMAGVGGGVGDVAGVRGTDSTWGMVAW